MTDLMAKKASRFSLLSQTPDRGTYVAYFLGAVVPLVAFGIALERYVFRAPLEPLSDYLSLESHAVLGLFVAITALTLFSFFLLRRLVRTSIGANRTLALYDSLTGLPNQIKGNLQCLCTD